MQYEDPNTSPFSARDLKKRLEQIQGEIRYISYTAEVLSKEMRLLVQKLETLTDDIESQEEDSFFPQLMVAHE